MISLRRRAFVLSGWTLVVLLLGGIFPMRADEPVVRAVLFYSPYCSHCHKVITEDLPPLTGKYGDQLQIIGVNIASDGGQALFEAAMQHFSIPADQQGVPALVIGETILFGSVDIPGQLPQLVETHLADGGVDWPAIAGLDEALAAAQATATPTASPASRAAETTLAQPAATTGPVTLTPIGTSTVTATRELISTSVPATETPGVRDAGALLSGEPPASGADPINLVDTVRGRLARDPLGNGLAVIVLLGMLTAAGRTIATFQRPVIVSWAGWRDWAIPVLAVIGLGVAGYLAYVETAQTRAVCGPVGDCNTVQQSEYARLFGIIPIGVLGAAGYAAILAAWVAGHLPGTLARSARPALFTMTLFGTLFSIYLTFLEPFVIGATCAWCLTSAVIMTCLLLLASGPGVHALDGLRSNSIGHFNPEQSCNS